MVTIERAVWPLHPFRVLFESGLGRWGCEMCVARFFHPPHPSHLEQGLPKSTEVGFSFGLASLWQGTLGYVVPITAVPKHNHRCLGRKGSRARLTIVEPWV